MSLFGQSTAQQPTGNLFGSTNQQPQQQPTGLFGNSAANQGSSLFGNTQNQQQQPQQSNQTGSLFGGSNAGTSLFGNTNQNQQQQQQQPSGGLFGSSTMNNTTTGTGHFGGQQQQQQQPQGGTGLFGNTQPQQSSGGLFGSTAGSSTGGGLFGSKPALSVNTNATQPSNPNPSNPLFGGGGGGLFGQNQQQPQQQTGGLFGANQNQPKPGLFGSFQSTSQNQTQPGGSLFGTNQSQQPGGSLLGASTLGQSTTAPNSNSLFGTSTLGTSTLGRNTLGLPSASQSLLRSSSTLPVRPDNDPQTQHARYLQRIQDVYTAWNPANPDCRFQYYFYNLVEPGQVSLYGRPPNALNDALWEKACKENPDPTCFVPVPAIGFDDLRQRVDAQTQQANDHSQRLKELQARLQALSQRHALSNMSRLQRAASQHIHLTQRLLHFIQHLHLLIPTVRSSPIRPEEEALRARLEEIEEDVRKGRLRGKLNELWAIIGAITAARERERGRATNGGDGEWAVVDEEGLAQLSNVLSQQHSALQYLMKTVKQQQRDVNVIVGNGPTDVSDQEVLYTLPSMLSGR